MTRSSLTPLVTMNRLALLGAWLFSIVIVIYPIFDYDLYWHLANGREMIHAGRIILEEIFSYTHFGEKFDNHEWLSQIIWYLIWSNFGLYGLFGFKLLVTSLVVLLLYRTIRFTGGQASLASILCMFAVLAGFYRYIERPELFSLLNTALISFILYGFRAHQLPRRLLWLIPVILVVWDWLHGSIYGLVLFTLFVAGENAKHHLPALHQNHSFVQNDLTYLNRCFGVAIVAMLINPLGLRSYGIFISILGGSGEATTTITEFLPVTWAEFKPFIFLLIWAVLLSLRNIRKLDVTQLLILVVFGFGALRYSRVTGVAAILLAPIIANLMTVSVKNAKHELEAKLHNAVAIIATVFIFSYGYLVKFSEASPQAFGYHVDESFLPAGSVRFINDMGLTGNLYNTGHFGGYLPFYLAPDHQIFQYNLPKIFGDTYRYVKHPQELDKWNINYAVVGNADELTTLFPNHMWARIYRDPGAVLVLRRTPQNHALIEQYEIRYFHPMMSDDELRASANNFNTLFKLAEEMGVYLAYRRDARIAGLWAEILASWPDLKDQPHINKLLQQALKFNDSKKLAQLTD